MLDAVAHQFGGDYGFFGYGDVAGPGRDYGDDSFAIALAVALKGNGASQRAVFNFGNLGGYGFVLGFGGTRGQDVSSVLSKTGEDLSDLSGRFSFTENHFGHAMAEGAMVIDLGEAEVFEG
jgi:hypothetical protein